MLIKEILKATGGKLLKGNLDDEITSFFQDSRKCKSGSLYIPIKGENNDGHDYIDSAYKNGANATFTEYNKNYDIDNVILVEDCLKALGLLAKYVREKSQAIVIGVTGSVGKTSTKDMIYSVVKTKYKALKTDGNYNNHIGLPLTILKYQDEEVMVIEMGMNHLKEIDYLTNIAKPNIAVITNVGTAHIGELGSRENILKAKMEIVNGLKPNGLLIINKDNDMLSKVTPSSFSLKSIGIDCESDLKAFDVELKSDSSTFKINYLDKTYCVCVPVPGKHFVYNALIALMVGLSLNIDIKMCIEGIKNFELTKNRADIIKLKDGITVQDGTYNANLDSMKSAIDILSTSLNRKIAVLGDMLELGSFDKELHEEVGKYLVKKNIDIVLAVGKSSKFLINEVRKKSDQAFLFKNNEELFNYLHKILLPNDAILVKASHGMHLEQIVQRLKEIYK